jgi:hypothetical protein
MWLFKLEQRSRQQAAEQAPLARLRMKVCETCPLLHPKYKTCQKCGCWMPGKTQVANAKCPEGRW